MTNKRDSARLKADVVALARRRREGRATGHDARPGLDKGPSDPLLEALHGLAEDILNEPVPERLKNALRKARSTKT